MILASRSYPGPDSAHPPLLILHGLLGSLRNWHSTAMQLAKRLPVHTLDLRNHGESFHHPTHTLDAMSADVEMWLEENSLEEVFLLGHSMGGKVAMRMARTIPSKLRSLIVIDISPRSYPSGSLEIASMRELDLDQLKNRKNADEALKSKIEDTQHRQFLLTNLGYDKERGLFWKVNLDALAENLDAIRSSPLEPGDRFDPPVHLIAGGKSPYVEADDRQLFERHFPDLRWTVLQDSGHNPHMDNREALIPLIWESCELTPDPKMTEGL